MAEVMHLKRLFKKEEEEEMEITDELENGAGYLSKHVNYTKPITIKSNVTQYTVGEDTYYNGYVATFYHTKTGHDNYPYGVFLASVNHDGQITDLESNANELSFCGNTKVSGNDYIDINPRDLFGSYDSTTYNKWYVTYTPLKDDEYLSPLEV